MESDLDFILVDLKNLSNDRQCLREARQFAPAEDVQALLALQACSVPIGRRREVLKLLLDFSQLALDQRVDKILQGIYYQLRPNMFELSEAGSWTF